MKINITNKKVIRALLAQDSIMKRHADEAVMLSYLNEDIKIYSSKDLIGLYNLLPEREKVLNDYINSL